MDLIQRGIQLHETVKGKSTSEVRPKGFLEKLGDLVLSRLFITHIL